MSQENVEIVRNAIAAFDRGDIEGVLRLCDEDIVITQLPGASREQHGHRGVLEALAIWPEQWMTIEWRLRGLLPLPETKCSSPSEPVDAESRAGRGRYGLQFRIHRP
jgi:SnoaL-like domain